MNLEHDGDNFKKFKQLILDCIPLEGNKRLQSLKQSISSEINFTGSDADTSLSIAAIFWDKFPGEFNKLLEAIKEDFGGNTQYETLNNFIINELDNKGITNKLKERSQEIKLTWELLQEVCLKTSNVRVAGIESKYEPNTYLQRQEALEVFRRFVNSDKIGFILTGKSGVGKSSFIMSLRDEYSDHSEVCLLIYNAATLELQQNLTEIICLDFNKDDTWRYRSKNNNDKVRDFWVQINQIEGIQSKKFILIIDAINENSDPNWIFRNINSLVESQGGLSWLKVIVTCRPESWNSIKRRVSLTEKNYYKTADESFSFELKKFSHLQQLESAKKSELEEVYSKYKEAYNLKSNYSELSGSSVLSGLNF